MFLVNPLYVITNVIYVKTDTRYVLVEKSCWNQITSILFKHRRPGPEELKLLKELFYLTYINYTLNNQKIDYDAFNEKIGEIQHKSEELDIMKKKLFKRDAKPIKNIDKIVELDVSNEGFFFDDNFLFDTPKEKEEESNFLDIQVQARKQFEEELRIVINYNLSQNEYTKSLVEYIGFGRILSLARTLFTTQQIRNVSKQELEFFVDNGTIMSTMLRMIQIKCPFKYLDRINFYNFICPFCESINVHTLYGRHHGHSEAQHHKTCAEQSIWFDNTGKISEEYGIKFEFNFISMNYVSRYENLTFTKHIDKEDNFSYKQKIENIKTVELLYDKYLAKLTEITTYMKENNLISKWNGKIDNQLSMQNWYAKMKAYESVKDQLVLPGVEFINPKRVVLTPLDFSIDFEFGEEDINSVELVNSTQIEEIRNSFFSTLNNKNSWGF